MIECEHDRLMLVFYRFIVENSLLAYALIGHRLSIMVRLLKSGFSTNI